MAGNWKVGDSPVTDEHKAELKELLAHEHPMTEIEGLEMALSARAAASHTHAIEAVDGLGDALDGKAAAAHTHDYAPADHGHDSYAPLSHSHDGYAATSHGHAIADVDGLQDELDHKADAVHTHDDYADANHDHDDTYAVIMHTHAISDISGLQAALDGKASTSHTHTGYAAASHTHAIADVTNLQSALDARTTRRFGTATGTTDASGLFTVTYSPAFSTEPIVCMEPPSSSNQMWVKVSGSASGCSFRLVQRGALTVPVVNIEALLAATTNVSGAPARMMVMGQ